MAVLVVADSDNAHLRDTTNKTITAALQLSGDVDLLVLGQGADAVAAAAARIAGVRKVILAEGADVGHGVAEAISDTIVGLMGGYDALLVPATSAGKNFAPRVAAKLDASPISDVIEVVSNDTFVRPIYAGNALETVQTADAKKVLTVRPTAFKAAGEGGSAAIEKVAAASATGTKFVSEEMVKSDRPELTAAKIVVSGGRAMGSAEEFQRVIEPGREFVDECLGGDPAACRFGCEPGGELLDRDRHDPSLRVAPVLFAFEPAALRT